MTTDDTPYSVSAVWSVLYDELKGTLWDDDDIDDITYKKNHGARLAAEALAHVHGLAEKWPRADREDSVLAVLKAAALHHGSAFLAPAQVKEMARKFIVSYRDFQEAADDYLEEDCGPVRWHWLNEHGRREIEKAVVKNSEIWIDEDDLTGVWVFRKPGR